MTKVTHWHNATVMLEGSQRVLCDPWLVGRTYMGAWTHWPPLPDDIIEQVGDCDRIWISHCHPDHYHPQTLRAYFQRWGDKPISTIFKWLRDRIRQDGFTVGPLPGPVFSHPEDDDSALVYEGIVNMNDNIFHQKQVDAILKECPEPDFALIPYSPAGPYPQTYFSDERILGVKARQKRQLFGDRFYEYKKALNAKVTIPFAGQYALCGTLAGMNRWRGQNDAVEFGLGLEPGGSVELKNGERIITGARVVSYPEPYDTDLYKLDHEEDGLRELCDRALIGLKPPPRTIKLHAGIEYEIPGEEGLLEIFIDPRLLRRLLTGEYHWDDAEIGSLYRCKRDPDIHRRETSVWLWDFHI